MFKLLEKVLASTAAEPLVAVSTKCSRVIIQAQRANAALVEVGDGTLATGKGIELLKPQANQILDRVELISAGVGNNIDLKDVYLIGSAADGVNCFYELY